MSKDVVPHFLYHSTPLRNRKSIMTKGLIAREPKGAGRGNDWGVYGVADIKELDEGGIWGGNSHLDIWEINTENLFVKPDEAGGMVGSYCIHGNVPPSQVKLVKQSKVRPDTN